MAMIYYETIKRAKEFNIPIKEAIKQRLEYLYKRLGELNEDYNLLDNIVSVVFVDRQRKKIKEEIVYLKQYKEVEYTDNRITDDMIRQAKNVPIESIIEFRNNKAVAFCHEDKNPSLSKNPRNNTARCFVCNETFNTIDAYMGLYNVSFKEAVRALT